MRVTWPLVKQMIDDRELSAQWVEIENSYLVMAIDGGLKLECLIDKSPSDTSELDEFESLYKPYGNQSPVAQVGTRFEDENIILACVRLFATADSNGDAVLEITVPGDFSAIERYAAGGEIYTENYAFEDYVSEISIVDYAGHAGEADAVLQSYVDQSVSSDNKGWFFSKFRGNEGIVEFEPLGYYGQIRGDLKLKVIVKVQPNAKVKGNLWWGLKG